jgi:hypothetical protein
MIIKDISFYLITGSIRWIRWSCFIGFLGFLSLIIVLLIGSRFSTPEGNAFILKTLVNLFVPSKLILSFQIKSLSFFPLIIEDFHISIAKMKSSPDMTMSFTSFIIRIEWDVILQFLKFWMKKEAEKSEISSPSHSLPPSSSSASATAIPENGGTYPISPPPSTPLSPPSSSTCSTVIGFVFTSFHMSSSSVSFKDFLGANPKPNETLYQSRPSKPSFTTSSSSSTSSATSSPVPGAVPSSSTAVPPRTPPAPPSITPTSSFVLLIKQFGCKIMKLIEIQFNDNFKFDFILPTNNCEMRGSASSMKIQFKDSKALKSLGLKIFVTILEGKMAIFDGEIPEKRIKAVDYRGNHAKICVDYYLPTDFMDVMMIMSGRGRLLSLYIL